MARLTYLQAITDALRTEMRRDPNVFLIGEDMIDKYILKNWLEKKNGYRVSTKLKFFRCVLTPTMCFANILRGKVPWRRDDRAN